MASPAEVRLSQRHEEIDTWRCDPLLVVFDPGLGADHAAGGLLYLNSRLDVQSSL
jgi:hypothetical protein